MKRKDLIAAATLLALMFPVTPGDARGEGFSSGELNGVSHGISEPKGPARCAVYSAESEGQGSSAAYSAESEGRRCPTADTATYAALDAKLEEFLSACASESISMQAEEADFLIGSCADSLVRQHVALKVYSHYLTSPYMGVEAVAIHVFDKWFDSSLVAMKDEADLINARIFAEFNRQSLVGESAPELCLFAPDSSSVCLPSRGRYSLLYFYDSSCAKCKLETALLSSYLSKEDPDLDFYAIYAGCDAGAWSRYREDRLSLSGGDMRIFHCWDPELESDFQKKYGVLQTPRMFLVGKDGTILGRGLDTDGLKQLLGQLPEFEQYEYGSEESEDFYDKLFSVYGENPTSDDIKELSAGIRSATLELEDSLSYRRMAGDLLYWLSSRKGETLREGLLFVVDSLVLSHMEVWASENDRLQILSFAHFQKSLLSRALPGSLVPDLEVDGVLLKGGRTASVSTGDSVSSGKAGTYHLGELGGRTAYVMFYSGSCSSCKAELEALEDILISDRKVRVLLVDMDGISGSRQEELLLDAFDLSYLPFIMEIDSDGHILRRYISFE